uniref:DH domain-containing protein n=1 Tax=Glossina brevipalpis TaxID=37001 RepID=A0A1A9WYU2_9MUSC
MDTESDDSERWEDFFGSSTELAPSVLGIYDTLTTELERRSSESNRCVSDNSDEISVASRSDAIKKIIKNSNATNNDKLLNDLFNQNSENVNGIESCLPTQFSTILDESTIKSALCEITNNSLSDSSESLTEPGHITPNKHRSNIRVLSPNVQRIITHSDIEPVGAVDIIALNNPPPKSPLPNRSLRKIPLCAISNKVKLSHIPLSKITGKLTLAGSDIVETFSQSCNSDNIENLRKTPPPPIPAKCIEKISTDNTSAAVSKKGIFPTKETSQIPVKYIIPGQSLLEDINFELASQETKSLTCFELNKTSSQSLLGDGFGKASEKEQIKSSTLVRSLSTFTTPSSDVDREYWRTDSERQQNISQQNTKNVLQTTGENQKLKFFPKEAQKMCNLILPDLARLKHRPLSSLSICSTSSSSSSGSGLDHLGCKHSTSYLASVESLADQSENELMEVPTGMTVFERACLEIVDSERSYVNDLGEVIQGYLFDWKERACLRYDELKVLFSNIEEIYEFNVALLKKLIDSGLDPVKISACFIEMKNSFEVYTTYCTSYPDAIQLLTKLLQATHTNALLTSTQKLLQHTLPLGSYLLKPVQRILKYHLLLDNLRKHCDIKEVMQAYEIMRQVARNIDQVKRKLEQQTRVKELSGILDGWLGPELTVLGELRLEGVLMESSKPRKVLLFSSMLIIAKAKEDNRLQFKSYIHQNNLMLSEHLAGEQTSFYIIPYDEPRNQIKLTAKNRDQKRLWTQHIKSVILEKFDNIPLRAKELVYQLGDEEDHSADKHSWKWSLTSASTPTYLERRNQYRRSEMRNRSKIKRKTISSPNTFHNLNDVGYTDSETVLKPISKSSDSINDKRLLDIDTSIEEETQISGEECKQCKRGIEEPCRHFGSAAQFKRMLALGSKPLKERSKSVPRMSISTRKQNVNTLTDESPSKSPALKFDETKSYSHKTFPKRITSLKKQRCNNKKETSTFYMTLSEFEDTSTTVLKITESSENISNPSQIDSDIKSEKYVNLMLSNVSDNYEERISTDQKSTARLSVEKVKQDAQIVLDLLRDSKEFNRFCCKLQKKRCTEKNFSSPKTPVEKVSESIVNDLPPRPPSKSPPPLEIENEFKMAPSVYESEPIYETLRRNVHVPYKFSPVFSRSRSVKCPEVREKSAEPTVSSDSDYVTLICPNDDSCRYEDQNKTNKTEKIICRDIQDSSFKDKNSSNTTVTERCDSFLKTRVTKNISPNNSGLAALIIKPAQSAQMSKNRVKNLLRSSTSTSIAAEESFFKGQTRSILHLQGSEAVGERIAHLDYADPRCLFIIPKSDTTTTLQRDSVFSLTSSNDSVCEQKRSKSKFTDSSQNFEYEHCVEATLENDFRDSAIYSDDTDRRIDGAQQISPYLSSIQNNYKPPIPPKILPTTNLSGPLQISKLLRETPKSETTINPSSRANSAIARKWIL